MHASNNFMIVACTTALDKVRKIVSNEPISHQIYNSKPFIIKCDLFPSHNSFHQYLSCYKIRETRKLPQSASNENINEVKGVSGYINYILNAFKIFNVL